MKSALFAVAALAALVIPAAADTLPKEVLGAWCEDRTDGSYDFSTSYKRGSNCDHDSMVVKPNSVEYSESSCTFSSIKTRTQTYFGLNQRPTVDKVFEVRAHCDGEGEQTNKTLFFSLVNGQLNYESFEDDVIPEDLNGKTVCKFDAKTYSENSDCEGTSLDFNREGFTITNKGEDTECTFTSVKTEWDSNISVATKLIGGPVTYIAAQCGKKQKRLATYVSKGTTYIIEKGK